ncbi:MAG: hypothetical protein II242_05465 [Peptococcaceae bacterium]|nr:hypothetical protein [Peptococcaceae bacterium]
MKSSKKPILIILCMLLFSAVLGIWIHTSGYVELQNSGLSYLDSAHDKYDLTSYTDSNAYTMEIDLTDLESNTGKRLWEDGEQYMEIASVSNEKDSGGYRVFFISHGVYDVNGGHLISGIQHSRPRENCVQYDFSADLITTYNDVSYQAEYQQKLGYAGNIENDGDNFSFYLFPGEAYENDNIPVENAGKATITVYNLTEHTWTRK